MDFQKLNSMVLTFIVMMYMAKVNAETSDDVKNLLNQIFNASEYNKAVRPSFDQTTPTDVYIDYYLTSIINFDSQKETLTTSGYLRIFWYDDFLQWTEATYGNLTSIFIPQDNVWKPDISLKNGISEVKELGSSSICVRAFSDGMVVWWPLEILGSTCRIDITYFPFDIQTCSLAFTAWNYNKNYVNVLANYERIILDDYEENSEWSILDTSVDVLDNFYENTIIFSIKLKRKPLFILLNLILPVILLSLLNVCIFILPVEAGERASFAMTLFLALVVYLSIVTATLPQNSENVSLFGIYLVLIAVFSTVIVILSLFILRLNFRNVDEYPIPPWLIKLHEIVETVRCRRHNKVHPVTQSQGKVRNFDSGNTVSIEEATSEFTESNSPTPEEKSKITWNHICNALDFISFWTFLLATVITMVLFSFICSKYAV